MGRLDLGDRLGLAGRLVLAQHALRVPADHPRLAPMRWFFIITILLTAAPAYGRVIPLPDADVAAVITRGLDGMPESGADRVVLFHGLRVTVEPSGTALTVEHRIERVLTVKGGRDLGVLWLGYDPSANEVTPKAVRVHRKSGGIEDMDLTAVVDVPAALHHIYWPFRALVLQLPRLLPGDSLEWVLERRGFSIAYLDGAPAEDPERFVPPMRGHFHDAILFAEAVPLVEKIYDLRLPPGVDLSFGTFGGPLDVRRGPAPDGGTRYVFQRLKAPALASEPRAPNPSNDAPKVVLATLSDWREKSTWFNQVNEPMFAHDAALREAVHEILEGTRTDQERVLRLLRWVSREIRYSGLQVIRGEGYTLHPGLLTWEHRAGVCKDIAGMLITMMRAAGFRRTWPAMTMAGARVEDIPADQFNHCVVAWERTDGDYVMLDPTWAPWSRHPWSLAESEQQYLVGAPLGDVLRTTPTLAPSDNLLEIVLDSRILADGTLKSRMKVRTAGYLETTLRRSLVGRPLADRRRLFEEIVRELSPAARIIRAQQRPEELEDLDEPLVLDLVTEAPAWAAPEKGSPLAFVPASFRHPIRHKRLWENLLVTGVAKRKRGLSFSCPKEISIREEIQLPGDYRLVSPAVGATVKTAIGSMSWSVHVEDGDRLITEQRVVFSTRHVGAESLKSYDSLVAPLQALETTPVLLVPEEGR